MNNFLSKIRIPTLLGFAIIILGMASGIYLNLQRPQTLISKASGSIKDIRITNIEDAQASISWASDVKAVGFVKYIREGESEQIAKDLRDAEPVPRLLHFVTLTNLIPSTTYQFKIVSGSSETIQDQFTSAPISESKNDFGAITGSVLDGDHFLDNGLIHLEIPGVATQSAVIKNLGNFIIPLSRMRRSDYSDIFSEKGAKGEITVFSEDGKKAKGKIALDNIRFPIGPLNLGQELDLTATKASPSALNKFDLKTDGIINSADVSLIIDNFGNNPKVPGADLNGDNIVDKQDIDLILNEMAKLGN